MDAIYFILAVVIGALGVAGQTESSLSDVLDSLPADYQGKVNASQIEDIKNKSSAAFKEKCEKNGGPDVFADVQKAYETFPNCVKESLGLSDPAVLQKEIEAAKPNGTVDEVFKKYCAKSPEVKECFKSAMDTVKPCFTAEEQKNLKILYNITEQLAGFICFKEGDRIALFIAEGGPECYQEKMDEIQDCVNRTYGGDYQFNTTDITANSIPQITFGEKECRQLNELQTCVVAALEHCQTPTSANIVESLFKFARKATPCADTDTSPGSASGLAVTSATIAIAVASTLLL